MPLVLKSSAEVYIEETAPSIINYGKSGEGPGVTVEFSAHRDVSEADGKPVLALDVRVCVGLDDEQFSMYVENINEIEALRDLLTSEIDRFRRDHPSK